MSTRLPVTAGYPRPANLAVLMREAFVALNDLVIDRLAERGHAVVRPAHGAVFQYLDDTGTTVSVLAERAQMTKQAMAELVSHLEAYGYVVRVQDPTDRRAKLVLPTDRGKQVVAIAQELVPEVEHRVSSILGADRVQAPGRSRRPRSHPPSSRGRSASSHHQLQHSARQPATTSPGGQARVFTRADAQAKWACRRSGRVGGVGA
jgi:DNA-binding MarR family transcriptional regulator